MANENYLQALANPPQTALTAAADYLGKHIGVIRKVFVCRQAGWESDTAMGQGTTTQIADPAEWDDVSSAADASKVLFMPYMMKGLTITPGEGKFVDKDGFRINPGFKNPTTCAGEFNAPTHAILEALEELKGYRDLYVMFVNEREEIIHGLEATAGTAPKFFSCVPYSWYISDPFNDPANGESKVEFSFQLRPGWFTGGFGTITKSSSSGLLTLTNS